MSWKDSNLNQAVMSEPLRLRKRVIFPPTGRKVERVSGAARYGVPKGESPSMSRNEHRSACWFWTGLPGQEERACGAERTVGPASRVVQDRVGPARRHCAGRSHRTTARGRLRQLMRRNLKGRGQRQAADRHYRRPQDAPASRRAPPCAWSEWADHLLALREWHRHRDQHGRVRDIGTTPHAAVPVGPRNW